MTQKTHWPGGIFKHAIRSWIDAVFPPRCVSCAKRRHPGRITDQSPDWNPDQSPDWRPGRSQDRRRSDYAALMSPWLCSACLLDYLPVRSPFCPKCGITYPAGKGVDHFCARCLSQPGPYGIARAAGVYDRSLMNLIHALKYQGKTQLALPLGRLLLTAFLWYWNPDQVDALLPVPLHLKRMRRRGFNQVYLLLKNWQRWADRDHPGLSLPPVEHLILNRRRWTEPQIGLDRRQRRINLKGAFTVVSPATVQGARLVVVDDVFTTGSTAAECCLALLAHGARRVDVLTLARAV